MKLSIVMGLVALSVIAMGGCSTMQDKSATVRGYDVDDAAYVDRVDNLARARGVAVHWVNPPQRHVAGGI
ncbi:MAG: hypothetical protein JWL98_2220 [Xanthomonadaceae bacterium]|jgi:hypothetical protein|nr:hypothetical protein [Xanthomonadaceae bacterium]